jgi:Cys-rich protein (TIGR01571 family)
MDSRAALTVISQYSSRLFGLEDKVAFAVSALVPCGVACLQALNVIEYATNENPGRAFFCACCLCSFGSALNRVKLQKAYFIEGSYLEALGLHCCCCCCAVSQECFEVAQRKKAPDADLRSLNGART